MVLSTAGMIVAIPIMGGWFRGMVVTPPENGCSIVKFMDYGGYSNITVESMRQIRADFMSLPFLATECTLSGVLPVEGS